MQDNIVEMIPVKVCGDSWLNPKEFQEQLETHAQDDNVVLDMGAEGASLRALGIFNVIEHWRSRHDKPAESVMVDRWPNTVEDIPYRRAYRPRVSHFFWLSDRYRPTDIIEPVHRYQFGYFMGRQTLPRRRIMWDMYHGHRERSLMSVMSGSYGLSESIDRVHDWTYNIDEQEFLRWFDSPPVGSIDGNSIQDQYEETKNTNLDLLSVYNQFDIEIVAESYTQGDTFFPTEKTIRPLAAGRPFLLYGSMDFLARLRDLGFKTWDDVWSETYDHYQGPERWRYMKSVIDTLSQHDPKDLWEVCKENCQHNHQLLLDFANRYRPTK